MSMIAVQCTYYYLYMYICLRIAKLFIDERHPMGGFISAISKTRPHYCSSAYQKHVLNNFLTNSVQINSVPIHDKSQTEVVKMLRAAQGMIVLQLARPKSEMDSTSTGDAVVSSSLSFVLGRLVYTQPAFACSKLTIETLEQSVKYVQS